MKRLYFFIFIFQVFIHPNTKAQKDSLSFYYNSWGFPQYQVNSKSVDSKEFNFYLSKNDPALRKFKAGRNVNLASILIQGTGGFLLGYNLADIMINKNKNYTTGAVGVGLIVGSIPLSNYGLKKSNQALTMFNTEELKIKNTGSESLISNKAEEWKDACLIVRIPVNAPKIRYLRNAISDPKINRKSKSALQIQLIKTLDENKIYFDLIQNGFNKKFFAKEVYFLPDSLYKSYMAGEKTGFLNKNNELDSSIECYSRQTYFIITGKDADQLLFVDRDLNKADSPFPHKKNTFLPAFRKLINKQGYINSQIEYFNEKLLSIDK